jgi:hypothetical protein
MERQSPFVRTVCYLLITAMALGALPLRALADVDPPRVVNVRTQVTDQTVYIYYSLIGSPERTYTISLVLRKRSNPDFKYIPKTPTGDYGPNVFVGTDWRAAWTFTREFPEGLDFKEYYFDVLAEATGGNEEKAGISTTWLVAGGAVVAGGLVGLLLMNKSATPTPVTPAAPSSFPTPPGRP